MKVNFEATLEEFVDVQKRSMGSTFGLYLKAAFVCVILGCAGGGFFYFISRNWLISAIVAIVSATAGMVSLIRFPERHIRKFLKNRVKITAPVPTEFEITENGLTSNALGQILTQAWWLIDDIQETDDAIYFKNAFGLYSAVRKRAFSDNAEMDEFLTLAKRYWSEAAVPRPPTFVE